jgi:hypothetical protein
VGHAWTCEALLASQAETLDAALWTACAPSKKAQRVSGSD